MNKLLLSLSTVAVMATSASALFVNGGFESGNFNGWSLSHATVPVYGGALTWTAGDNGLNNVISASSPMLYGQSVDINPYNGNYMARLDNLEGNYDASKISQTDVITAADLNDTLFVNWGALLVEPSINHGAGNCPYFGISVLKNGVSIQSFAADAVAHDASWSNYGDYDGTAWYKSNTWSYDLSSFNVGDNITVEMYVADCAWGGHGGAAYLDGIGTTYVPPKPVPEPGMFSLFGFGLLGLFGFMKSRKRK